MLPVLVGLLAILLGVLVTWYGERVSEFARQRIEAVRIQYRDSAAQITAFQQTLTVAVTAANALCRDIIAYMIRDAPQEEREAMRARIEEEFRRILERVAGEMRMQFPPLDRAPNHEEREQRVDYALERVNAAMGDMFRRLGVPEVHVESLMRSSTALVTPVRQMIVIVGDLGEQHPQLPRILLTSAAIIFGIPQTWILRILLRRFGFRSLGFFRGNAAAMAQRAIFGSLIPQGVWFEILGTLLLY